MKFKIIVFILLLTRVCYGAEFIPNPYYPQVIDLSYILHVDIAKLSPVEFKTWLTQFLRINISRLSPQEYEIYMAKLVDLVQSQRFAGNLQNTIKSQEVTWAIQNRDWVRLRQILSGSMLDDKILAVIDYIEKTLPPAPKISRFFVGLGEITPEQISKAVDLPVIDALLVPIYNYTDWKFGGLNGKKIIPAFDLDDGIFLALNMPDDIIMCVTNGWGWRNAIDLVEYNHPAEELKLTRIGQINRCPIGMTLCLLRDDRDEKWIKANQGLDYNVVFVWVVSDYTWDFEYILQQVQVMCPGKQYILCGFYGFDYKIQHGSGQIQYLIEIMPNWLNHRKAEGWSGVILQGGIERWGKVLVGMERR